jgi:hypothetical protein
MSGTDTKSGRGYGWALQTDYATEKAVAAAAYKRIIATDENFIDYTPNTADDEAWSNGVNSATDQWLTRHDVKVNHTIVGFAQILGQIFILNLGDYAITTPPAGVTSKTHTFKPTDPTVTRQDKAVTYLETTGSTDYKLRIPSAVSDGFSLKGDESGVLTCDIGLQGSGAMTVNGAETWTGVTPSVARQTGLTKFYNTQMNLAIVDPGGTTNYGCRYRSFSIDFKKTLLTDAGFKPGCAKFLVNGDPDSGQIRSECLFDKQMLDFTFNVAMAAGSPEIVLLQQQKPLAITLTATGGIIEGIIPHSMVITIPVGKYTTTKPVEVNGLMHFAITGKALFDFATSQLFRIALTTNVASFTAGW